MLLQIGKKFRSNIPLIVNVCEGVIGRDALTNQFVEVTIHKTNINKQFSCIAIDL